MIRTRPRAPRAVLRRILLIAAIGAALWIAHDLAAKQLVDHGVAGALLAGGGGWVSIVAAAGFVVARLVGTVALALLPAVLVHRQLAARGGGIVRWWRTANGRRAKDS